MQQGFGVVLRLCGKCNENKMFSSVPWNLYGCFVVFINIICITVNLLQCSARDDSLGSWSLLNAQAQTSPVVFILSSQLKYVSSCIRCSRWHRGTERSWWHQERCRELWGCSCPGNSPCMFWRDRGTVTDGQGVTGGISWLALWGGEVILYFQPWAHL